MSYTEKPIVINYAFWDKHLIYIHYMYVRLVRVIKKYICICSLNIVHNDQYAYFMLQT